MRRTALIVTVVLVVAGFAAAADEEGTMLEAGMPFPAFTLTAQDGSVVSSAELAGRPYLIYYYPKADTPGCTREACELRDRWTDIQDLGLAVLGVSYDSPKDNRAFAEKFHLQFRLLSDQDRELAKQVGAVRALLPLPKRISYLVGSDGMVLKAYPSVDPKTHAAEVLDDLRRLAGETAG